MAENRNSIEESTAGETLTESAEPIESAEQTSRFFDSMPQLDNESVETAEERQARRQARANRIQRLREREAMNLEGPAFTMAWQMLATAKLNADRHRPDRYVQGTIVGVMTLSDSRGPVEMAGIMRMPNSPINLTIPWHEMEVRSPISPTIDKREQLQRQTVLLQHMVGAQVSVIIKDMWADKGSYYVYASRKEALLESEERNFEQGLVKPNTIVSCQIISVGTHGLMVSCYGVDTIVKNSFVTGRYIRRLSDVYAPGDKIDLMIVSIADDPHREGGHRIHLNGVFAEQAALANRADLPPIGMLIPAQLVATRAIHRPDGSLNPNSNTLELYSDTYDMPLRGIFTASNVNTIDIQIGDSLLVEVLNYQSHKMGESNTVRVVPTCRIRGVIPKIKG